MERAQLVSMKRGYVSSLHRAQISLWAETRTTARNGEETRLLNLIDDLESSIREVEGMIRRERTSMHYAVGA